MKVFKRLLLGTVAVLLVCTLCWWLNERRYSPDERLYRTLQSDLHFCFMLYDLSARAPGQWTQDQLANGGKYFLDCLAEKEVRLQTSGYFTNYRVFVTNFPAAATNNDLKFTEINRRLAANLGVEQQDEFHTLSGPDNDGKVNLTCRAERLPEFVRAMTQP